MDKNSIKLGVEYAVREPVAVGAEMQRVKVLEPVRAGKWKVEWIDPNPGLIDYVASKNIIVPWSEHRSFLRDEQRREGLLRTVEYFGFPGDDSPLDEAVRQAFDATGEREVTCSKGVLSFEPDAVDRIAARANIETPSHPSGYRDRHGTHHLPWQCALELAEAFTKAEPRTVLIEVEKTEQEWTTTAHEPGGSYIVPLLNRYRASWAILRQWATYDQAVAVREERIEALERLLTTVMWDLRRPQPDTERISARIERALRGQ